MARKTQAQIEFKVVTSEFSSGIKEMNSSIKTMNNELKLNSAQLKNNSDDVNLLQQRQSILQRQYEATSKKVELTEKSLEEAKRLLGENSTEYRNLSNAVLQARTAQQNIQNELEQTADKIEAINQANESTEGGFRGFINNLKNIGTGAKDAEGGFTVLKGTIAEFAGNVLSSAVGKINEFVGSLFSLADETEEFRMNMAKLDGSTSQYGYSTEFTNNKIKELYGYFKDDQVAVNTLTNLQGMGLSQNELANALNAGIAVWTAYGDSIPIEGLTESINESSQVGQVTGSLADALNWAGVSEDDFNKKLEKCNSTKERAQLITDTLNNLYGKSKETYDENTESLRENNEAEMEMLQAKAELGEAMEPVNTAMMQMGATVLQTLTPAIQWLSSGIQSIITWFQGLPAPIQQGIVVFGLIIAVIVALCAVIAPLISVASTLIPVIAGISLPALGVVAAITALIAVGIALWKNWDVIKVKASQIWNAVKSTVTSVVNNMKSTVTNVFNRIKSAVVNTWNSIKSAISNACSNIYNSVNSKFNAVKNKISSVINSAKSIVSNGLNKIKGFFSNCKLSFPKIKLPHFSITGKLSVNPPSVPKFAVKWYREGGIMTKPTLFGAIGNKFLAGGEAGNEAILPLDNFYQYMDSKLSNINLASNIDYERMTESFIAAIRNLKLDMDGKKVADIVDRHSGKQMMLLERGLNI